MRLVSSHVVKTQLPALKPARLAVEKINERKLARRDQFLRVIAVRAEKIAIVARRYLSLHLRHRKLLHPKLIQHPRQHSPNSLQNEVLMLSQIHEHAGAAMAVVCHSRISSWRNHFTGLEIGLMLQRVGNKFVEFLWSQEFIQHDAF